VNTPRPLKLAVVVALAAIGCANRGMRAPDETDLDASLGIGGQATGGSASGGVGGMGGAGGSGGRGGSPPATGGAAGGTFSTGGAPGTGGSLGGAGGIGSGGTSGVAGTNGTGGSAGAGGSTGAGGAAGAAGTNGAAGSMGGAGMAGSGQAGAGGAAGGKGGGTGGASASGGASGAGGAAGGAGAGGHAGGGGSGGASGAGGYTCPAGGVLDCSSSGALKLAGGQVTDFSSAQWGSATQFCDPGGLRGHVFSYSGASPSAATAAVDTTAQNLKLDLTVAAQGYAGGGLSFESCVNASAFTSVQFTASVTSGSLTGCVWQVQLETQDQRDATATDPTGGTCTSNCYRYPAVTNLATPATGGSAYSETFTLFNNPASSTIATPTQVTGIQWQVNSGSSGTGTCTVELRIAGVSFH